MNSLLKGRSGASALLLLMILLGSTSGQETGEQCLARFKKGREDFILEADESVKRGATFISSPQLNRHKDCLSACCKDPKCNVAFMERGDEEGLIKTCFLFDCLYKKQYVCRFVRKTGYMNYIQDTVYEISLKEDAPPNESDRPPVANGGPDLVIQPQESVALNGMGSKDDNEIVSFHWKMLTPYPYAVIEKTTFKDQIMVSNLTSGIYKFQLTVTDSIGQSDSAKVTVLVLTPEQSEHHCMAPKKVGPCRGAFPRWHYNAASENCEQFTWGGCRENLNNYITEDECNNACHVSEKAGRAGRGLPVPGPQGEKCDAPCTTDQFTCANGCCLDPGLECDSTSQCSDSSDELNCEDLNNKFQILIQIPVDEQKVRCTEHPQTGTCRESFSKWYYNPLQEECFRFNYGGCEGNDNRFDTKEDCISVCRGVTENDVFSRKGEYEARVSESQTGTIAIAALLGVAIFIILCVLVYFLMKGKKKSSQHQRVPVYNSTTKPI